MSMDDLAIRLGVHELLAEYAERIDDDRLEEWPDLFTEQCRYLVRRPNEIFLGEGETEPETEDDGRPTTDDSDSSSAVGRPSSSVSPSQEALLNQPVYIPHRPLKDFPRPAVSGTQ